MGAIEMGVIEKGSPHDRSWESLSN